MATEQIAQLPVDRQLEIIQATMEPLDASQFVHMQLPVEVIIDRVNSGATTYFLPLPGSELSPGNGTVGDASSSPKRANPKSKYGALFTSERRMTAAETFDMPRSGGFVPVWQDAVAEATRYRNQFAIQCELDFMKTLDNSIYYDPDLGTPFPITGDPAKTLSDLDPTVNIWNPVYLRLRELGYYFNSGPGTRRKRVMVISEAARAYFSHYEELGARLESSRGEVRLNQADAGNDALGQWMRKLRIEEAYVSSQAYNVAQDPDQSDMLIPNEAWIWIGYKEYQQRFDLRKNRANPRPPVCGPVKVVTSDNMVRQGTNSPEQFLSQTNMITPVNGSKEWSMFADGWLKFDVPPDYQAFNGVPDINFFPGLLVGNIF